VTAYAAAGRRVGVTGGGAVDDAEAPVEALLLRAVPIGESDLMLTLLARKHGKVQAMARGARNSKRRFAGSLEPFHVLAVRADMRRDVWFLREVTIALPRLRIAGDLAAIESAGVALRMVRDLCPAGVLDTQVYAAINTYLTKVDAEPAAAAAALLQFGFALLRELGYELDWTACAVCGKALPPDRPACVNIARGGIVCRDCGGGPQVISAVTIRGALEISDGNASVELDAATRATLQAIVDAVVRMHASAG
jgi:DNA repair protein RecO (recombination protein O)